MGATKLLAERLTISANMYRGQKRSSFSCVRFGNVLNSRGSVIPLFTQQIQKGEAITVTHPEMRRFFMDIPSATELILKAGMLAKGNEIFILKMPAARIMDLAEVMRDLLAPQYGFNPEDIPIEIIGVRVGEKIDEELLVVDETSCVYENEDMILVIPKQQPFARGYSPQDHVPDGFHLVTMDSYSSKDAKLLTKEEIATLLNKIGIEA
jgi:FlaA1/EpsC-like NDP-sugar epimerase